PRRCYSARF
ncbi:hypothetical protein BN1723_019920, partial [Verticillium longisporum]